MFLSSAISILAWGCEAVAFYLVLYWAGFGDYSSFTFAIFVYYHNFQKIIFVHAAFLYYLLLAKDFVKDLQNIKGDFALGYHTIATDYGERSSKQLITVLIGLTLVCIYFLTAFPDTGSMKYYFILTAIILLGGFLPILWKGRTQIHYAFLRNLLKVIIVVGVCRE